MQALSLFRLCRSRVGAGLGLIPTTALAALIGTQPLTLAQTVLPSSAGLNFQTSGPARAPSIGDWYTTTSSASTTRYHSFFINLTAADIAAAGGSVSITVLDAESNGGLPDEVTGTPDPTRFDLISPTGTVINSQIIASGSPDGTTITFPGVSTPGVYEIRSVTGAGPISGNTVATLNDDDNGFSISAPVTGLLLGQLRGTFQNSVVSSLTVPFYFLTGPDATNLFLRNFDLDSDGTVTYSRPTGATSAGTVSGQAVWNGGTNNLNTGGDSLAIANPIAEAGRWTITLSQYGDAFTNQSILEANIGTGPGNPVPLFDQPPTRAGNFTITPNTTLSTTIGNTVCHPFTVINNFFTTDIINLTLAGTDPNYTVQLRDAAGTTPLGDTDGDGNPDTGILAALNGSGNFTLCVTPNAGAPPQDVTRINAISFMDTRIREQAEQGASTPQFVDKTTTIPATGAIGDFVFNDLNGNGVPDPGEPGIAGVPVTLKDVNGNVISTTTTDANGIYQFTNVPAGSYFAEIIVPVGFQATNDTPRELALDPGQTLTDIDFGVQQPPGAIGDRVFNDLDGNGIQDPNEPGLGGVTITLTDANGNVVATTVTNADGSYQFTNVAPGNYTVTVTPPAGFSGTTPSSQTVTLAPGQTVENIDFGLRTAPGTVGNLVFNDTDGDGIPDPGEPGLGGVPVTLTGTDTNGNAVTLTTTTDPNGNYQFTNVPPGSYTVSVTPTPGLTATTPNPQTITLNPGQVLDTVDFGFRSVPGSVGDRVFNDLDGDGIQDPGELGIPGVTITLTGTDANGNPVTLTTTTDANGSYRFTNVPPGSYSVTATPPPGFSGTTPSTQAVTLTPGQSVDNVDFGLRQPPATIRATVFNDPNGNGAQDPGEPGLAGVTVTLTGTDANGNPVTFTTRTDANGNYEFPNLPPGNYSLTVTPPPGFSATTPNPQPVTLTPGQILETTDVGLRQPGGTIGDRVFNDVNGNGAQDTNEPGLGNVTVTLRDPNGAVVATTTTDANGNYQFTNVAAGSYTVTVTPLSGFQLTTGETLSLGVAVGQTINNIDFGLQGGQPNLRLVKRITNATRAGAPIGGVNFGGVVDDPADPDDNAAGWSQLPLAGVLNLDATTPLRTGDEVTYTVYFLSDGSAPLRTVSLCDQIPVGTTFVPNSTEVRIGNTPFTTGDRFFSPLAPLPADNSCDNATNPNGSVIVNLGDISNSPGSNVGLVRFRVRID